MNNFVITLMLVGMSLTTWTLADDADDVKAAVEKLYEALNAGDAEKYIQSHIPTHSVFAGGGFLAGSSSLEEQRRAFQAGLDAGLKRSVEPRHIEVQVYGKTAVAPNYTIGSITQPGGSITPVRVQRTAVLIKQGDQWRKVHQHRSPLTLSTPRIEDRFVGTWKFVSITFRGPDGEPRPAPDFENGLLIYTSTGEVALQLMRKGRQEFAAGSPTPEEALAGIRSYFAYFGTFTVNETAGTVTYFREAHIIPNRITDRPRSYQFSGNRLMLTTPPIRDGIIQTLTWERVE